jgi:hypothetical protein
MLGDQLVAVLEHDLERFSWVVVRDDLTGWSCRAILLCFALSI